MSKPEQGYGRQSSFLSIKFITPRLLRPEFVFGLLGFRGLGDPSVSQTCFKQIPEQRKLLRGTSRGILEPGHQYCDGD